MIYILWSVLCPHREALAFATEPVFSSLANVLGNRDNMGGNSTKFLENFTLFEVEIKHGLLQVHQQFFFFSPSFFLFVPSNWKLLILSKLNYFFIGQHVELYFQVIPSRANM